MGSFSVLVLFFFLNGFYRVFIGFFKPKGLSSVSNDIIIAAKDVVVRAANRVITGWTLVFTVLFGVPSNRFFYWVFTGFYWARLDFMGFSRGFIGFYWVLLGLNQVELGFTRFY